MEMHISDYLRYTRIPDSAYKSWKRKKIREIREHVQYLMEQRYAMAPDTTRSLSGFDEDTEQFDLNGYNSEWITQGWMNDRYVEYDEDFSDLFNSTSPSYETIKDIHKLKS